MCEVKLTSIHVVPSSMAELLLSSRNGTDGAKLPDSPFRNVSSLKCVWKTYVSIFALLMRLAALSMCYCDSTQYSSLAGGHLSSHALQTWLWATDLVWNHCQGVMFDSTLPLIFWKMFSGGLAACTISAVNITFCRLGAAPASLFCVSVHLLWMKFTQLCVARGTTAPPAPWRRSVWKF